MIGLLRNNKKNILYILHEGIRDCDKNNIGGVQKHISDLISFFKERFNFYVLWHEGKSLKVIAFCGEEQKEFSFPFFNNHKENELRNYETFLLFHKIIKDFAINIVHIHHIMGLNFEVFYAAKSNKIPIILTLHDYYFICPNIFLMYKGKKYCELDNRNKCYECIKNSSFKPDYVKRKRNEFIKVIGLCDYIIVPDESVYKNYSEVIGDFSVNIIPNGVCSEKENRHTNVKLKNDTFLDVAFIGQLSNIKGSRVALNMIKHNQLDNVRWHLFGLINDIWLKCIIKKNTIKHGKYAASDISKLLIENNIDVVCIPSQAPETFSYTLSESWMAGIPVISSDIGALGNRIRKNGGGLLVQNYDNYREFLDIIYKLGNDRMCLNGLKAGVHSVDVHTIEEIGMLYKKIYEDASSN